MDNLDSFSSLTAYPAARSEIWPAIWHDGLSAVAHPVILCHREAAAELCIYRPGTVGCSAADDPARVETLPLSVWSLHSLQVLSGKLTETAMQPVRLAVQPDTGQRLVLQDAAAIAAVARWYSGPRQARKSRILKRWVAATIGVWLFCGGLYLVSPWLFKVAAHSIPQSWEESMGKSTQETMITVLTLLPDTRGICEAGTDSPDLRALMRRLEQAAPVKGYTFRLTVLDADFVNAFAAPGGYIVVSTGLIKDCESPDELAGVLAHEMTHVTERHGTSSMLRHYVWSGFMRMMGGNDQIISSIAFTAVSSSFSRDDEREADQLGASRLVQAGITPQGMAAFFARLEKEDPDTDGPYSYFASHPQLGERQKNINLALEQSAAPHTKNGSNAASAGQAFTPSMDAAAWARVKALCSKKDTGKSPKTPVGDAVKP